MRGKTRFHCKINLLSRASTACVYSLSKPLALPGAQLAWTHPYPNSDVSAAAYAMQWNNPRPDVKIASIDMIYGSERCGVPCLIAVTAATAP